MTRAGQEGRSRNALATVIFGCVVLANAASAQDWVATELGASPPEAITGAAFLEWHGDGPAPLMPDDNHPNPDSPEAPQLTFSYYTVSGATLRGRSSTTGYTYQGLGCSYATAGDRLLNTELPIPDGATIKYLRVYYYDTNATAGVRGYVTRYQPGVATSDLVTVASTAAFAGGYGFTVSTAITEIADNTDYAYTVIGWPDQASSSLQICGLRVAYYAP